MTRRLWLFAVVLSLVAMPALARRRAITPRTPSSCPEVTLVRAMYAQLLAADAEYVYFMSEFGALMRVPKLGGTVQPLANDFEEWLTLSMTVDDTHVYIGALPLEALFMPRPGVILKVPKNGGVVSVLLSGVITPFDVATDATHVYWVSAGTLNLAAGSIAADGKVERAKKDGSERLTLANDLSAPIGFALDGNDVYFGQSGGADGDPTVGLYRVAKTGGTVATINSNIAVGPLALDGNTIVVLGATNTEAGVLAIEKNGAPPPRLLYAAESINGAPRIADRRAYFLEERDGGEIELTWVSIDAPAGRVGVRKEFDGSEFLLDGCAAVVNTFDGNIERIHR